jgi:chemotaxis protein methyltransferase CheR
MRSTPPLVKQRYFRPDGSFWSLDPEVKSMVSFEVHNLRDVLGARRHGRWDVIFCRNVMIYFDDAMKKQTVNLFGDLLADDGHLFIGHSESLRGIDPRFEALSSPQAFAYRKVHGAHPAPVKDGARS